MSVRSLRSQCLSLVAIHHLLLMKDSVVHFVLEYGEPVNSIKQQARREIRALLDK